MDWNLLKVVVLLLAYITRLHSLREELDRYIAEKDLATLQDIVAVLVIQFEIDSDQTAHKMNKQ